MNLPPVLMTMNMPLNHQYRCKFNENINQDTIIFFVQTSTQSEVRHELTFSASDNEDIPESPILFHVKQRIKRQLLDSVVPFTHSQ